MIEDDSINGSYQIPEIPPFKEQEFASKDEEFILKSVKKNGKITAPWIVKYRPISVDTARRILKRLENNGILSHKIIKIRTQTNGTRVRLYMLRKNK